MKTISKILLTVALLIGSIHVSAQYTSTHGTRKSTPNTTYKETVRWRINLGMNASTMRGEGVTYIEQIGGDKKNSFGISLGAVMEWKMGGNWYLQPGFYFMHKGWKEDYTGTNASVGGSDEQNSPWHIYYIDIPILVSFHLPISDQVNWQIGAGPFVSLGLFSNNSFFGSGDLYYDGGLSFSENRGGKRFDTGFDFETGIAINKIYIGIDYAIGVVDISSLNSLKTNNFTIKAGYYF